MHVIIKDITGYVLPKGYKVMYLGSINDDVSGSDRYLTKILLITSKKAITQNWYKTYPPSIEQWLEIEIYEMEKPTFQLRLRESAFASKWKRWMIYDTVSN